MLLAGIQLLFRSTLMACFERGVGCAFKKMSSYIPSLFNNKGIDGSLILGLIWGMVPCGVVYSLILMAAATGSYVEATTTVLFFGLGTLPALFTIIMGTSWTSGALQSTKFKQIGGGIILLAGLWTLLMPMLPLHGMESVLGFQIPIMPEVHSEMGLSCDH